MFVNLKQKLFTLTGNALLLVQVWFRPSPWIL